MRVLNLKERILLPLITAGLVVFFMVAELVHSGQQAMRLLPRQNVGETRGARRLDDLSPLPGPLEDVAREEL